MNNMSSEVSAVASHTPLPWHWAHTGPVMKGYSQPFGIWSQLPSDKTIRGMTLIAGCFGDVEGGEATAQANAELIVHAVNCHSELVEACKLTLAIFKECEEAHECLNYVDAERIMRKCQDALKKAGAL